MRKPVRLFLTVAVVAALAVAGLAWDGHRRFTAPGPLAEATDVVIAKGSGLDAIARRLEEAGVIDSRWVFVVGAKLRRANLKAGEFTFPAHISPEEAVRLLAEGRTVVHKLTIAEGLTTRAVLDLVRQADFLSGDITLKPAEGALLPETWHLSRDDARDEVVARMEKAMHQTVDTLWAGRDRDLPLKSAAEAVVLASMVERETPLAGERPRVAAVFYNRLRAGMRLQSDPTVIYGLSDGWGILERSLVHDDLAAKHPWNTYVIDGLPPSPIANPGRASLEAVLHPAHTAELYFVADGNGGHVFAKTLAEHNANVTKWRAIQRQRGAE
jgi:UPF0755 protein